MTFNDIMRMVARKRYYGYGKDMMDEEEARQFRQIMKEAFSEERRIQQSLCPSCGGWTMEVWRKG